jgi:hypothetical protein
VHVEALSYFSRGLLVWQDRARPQYPQFRELPCSLWLLLRTYVLEAKRSTGS